MKKFLYVVLGLFLLVIVTNVLPKKQYERENLWLKDNNEDKPLVMAHAGGRLYNPGNTIRAFQYSFDLGVDVLEMDVHMTSDNVLVLRHGENNTGNIRAMSNCDTVIWKNDYQWLYENCNFGYNFKDDEGNYPYRDLSHNEWVEEGVYLTTLDEVFETFGEDILYNIEIKADADAPRLETADELYNLISKYNLENNVLVATAFEDISEYLRFNYSDLYISASHSVAQDAIVKTISFTDIFFNPKETSSLQIPTSYGFPVIKRIKLDTKLLIRNLQNQNVAVHYWTINDEDDMKNLIELGVDGIITDDPIKLMNVINNY